MKFLFLMIMLPILSHAQVAKNFNVNKVGSTFFVTPNKVTFSIEQINKPRRDACFVGNITLKDVSVDYIKYQCDQNGSHDRYCKSLVESVEQFAEQMYGDEFGPISSRFKIVLPDLNGLTPEIAQELGTNLTNVKWLVPSLSKGDHKWQIQRINSNGLYGRIADVLRIAPKITIKGDIIEIGDRFTFCQLKEEAFQFSSQSAISKEVRLAKPNSEVKALQSFYHDVRSDWEKSDQATQWKNSIHPLFSIGSILKKRMQSSSVKSLYSLEELYDRMFQHYIIDNEFSVYIKHFKSDEEFELSVHPGTIHNVSATSEFSNY